MRLIQSGPRDAKIVAVGEAPGPREDQEGYPFIGGSGSELDRMFNNVSILRSECFMTNVCHTRPPKNDFSWFLRPKPKLEYIQGLIQLKADLEEIRPNLVIALGAQPLRALTNRVGIDKWRGSILECTLVKGLKVIATYHPAYILRVYDYKAVAEIDLARCLEESKFPEIILPECDIIIDPDTAARAILAGEMAAAEWLSIDIECFDTSAGWKLACVGFSDRPDRALVLPARDDTMPIIQFLCASPAKKVFQNGYGFDVPVLGENGIEVRNYGWDTMIGMHVRFIECAASDEETTILTGRKKPTQPAFRKGLAFQTSIWTKEPRYKDDGKLWKETQDLDMFRRYNGKDAARTGEIRDRQEEELIEFGVLPVFEREMALIEPLAAMTRRGIPVDAAVKTRLIKKYRDEIENLQKFLDSGAGQPINVKSNPDMRWLLFDKLGLPVIKRSDKTSVPSADKTVINTLAEKHPHPLLMTILEIRERRDLLERYLEIAIDADGRMRCHWDPTGSRTARLASRVTIHGTGTNLQNQPPELRQMYVPEPGKVMWSVDYSQAEIRVVAWLARCEALIELFNDPTRDVHKENATRFYNIPVELITFAQRYTCKRIVHGSDYGMQFFKCWQVINNDYRDTGIRVSIEEVRLIQEAYFMLYPEIKNNYWEDVRRELRETLTLVTPYPFERKREFFGRWDEKFLNEGYAYKPQSTVGEMTNTAMTKVHHTLPEAELFVNGHDSLIGQCDPSDAIETVEAVQECMRIPLTIHGRELIIPTDVEVGYNWGKRTAKPDGTIENPRGLRPLSEWLEST